MRVVLDKIRQRGGAEPGDKTVVDVLTPMAEILDSAGDQDQRTLADDLVTAAADAVRENAAGVSRRGRAGWIGDRSTGKTDPGSVALLRLTEEFAQLINSPDRT
jgi:dihydroxyacetone kinase